MDFLPRRFPGEPASPSRRFPGEPPCRVFRGVSQPEAQVTPVGVVQVRAPVVQVSALDLYPIGLIRVRRESEIVDVAIVVSVAAYVLAHGNGRGGCPVVAMVVSQRNRHLSDGQRVGAHGIRDLRRNIEVPRFGRLPNLPPKHHFASLRILQSQTHSPARRRFSGGRVHPVEPPSLGPEPEIVAVSHVLRVACDSLAQRDLGGGTRGRRRGRRRSG